MDLGVTMVRRETFHSALTLTEDLLLGLGIPAPQATRTVKTFQQHDEARLARDHADAADLERMQQRARKDAEELERLFAADAAEMEAEDARHTGS
jgi:glycine/D-amino acid oxidase-like deaminating enzyme